MKRFDIILLFFVFLLSSTVLFQNCSEMKSTDLNSATNAQGDGADDRVVPEFLANRTITLDNKVVSNANLETVWSVGGTDTFYYETDYQATYESTLVTITGENSFAILTVAADDCTGQRTLTYDESVELSGFFASYIPSTEIRVRAADEAPITQGCAFPRLSLDATGLLQDDSPATDFDIYFSTPECTPDNEFHVTDRDGNDPAAAQGVVETFFNAQIDLVCQ